MTKKEFAEKYNRGMCFDEEFISDLNALLRDELIKFMKWYDGDYPDIEPTVDEYLNRKQ